MNSTKKKSFAREYALKYLYHLQLEQFVRLRNEFIGEASPLATLQESIQDFDESFRQEDQEHPDNVLDGEVKNFANQLIEGVLLNYDGLQETVKKHLKKWTLERLDKLDLTILLVGAYEINFLGTPPKVVINESVNLAKKYGTRDSYSFINGVLDRISKDQGQESRDS